MEKDSRDQGLNRLAREARPLKRGSLTTAASQELRRLVMTGIAGSGEYLPPQEELARTLGIGLSTLREAVKGLELLGVVRTLPGKGTLVTKDGPSILRLTEALRAHIEGSGALEVHEARRVIEVALVALACERATEEDINTMQEAMVRVDSSRHEPEASLEADLDFHMAVARASKNHLLCGFYQVVMDRTAETVREGTRIVGVIDGLPEASIQKQWMILKAIRSGDSEVARGLTESLLQTWDELYLQAVGMKK